MGHLVNFIKNLGLYSNCQIPCLLADHPSLNPAEVYIFCSVKLFEKTENKMKKRAAKIMGLRI